MAQDAALGSLVDELLTCIATFLPDAASLLAFERVSSRFSSVAHEAAWRGLCEKRWEDKPRYRLTAKREAELSTHMRTLSWRRRYATFEVDGRRSSITDEELCSLHESSVHEDDLASETSSRGGTSFTSGSAVAGGGGGKEGGGAPLHPVRRGARGPSAALLDARNTRNT